MNLDQFLVTTSTPNRERSVWLGSEYNTIGRVLAHIQAGYYRPGCSGWNLSLIRKRGNIAIVKGRDVKAHWSGANNLGYQQITCVWAVVDTTSDNVLSYYALFTEGTYDDKGIKTRTIVDARQG